MIYLKPLMQENKRSEVFLPSWDRKGIPYIVPSPTRQSPAGQSNTAEGQEPMHTTDSASTGSSRSPESRAECSTDTVVMETPMDAVNPQSGCGADWLGNVGGSGIDAVWDLRIYQLIGTYNEGQLRWVIHIDWPWVTDTLPVLLIFCLLSARLL